MQHKGSKPVLVQKRRIFLVDDHPIVRAGFAQLLELQPDLEVCAEAGTANEALQVLQKTSPDLAIIDISLEGSQNGLELIKTLQSFYPKLPLLVLSIHAESVYAQRALRAGAKGYITKDATTQEIMRAIRLVLDGGIYLSSRMNDFVVNKMFSSHPPVNGSPLDCLTDRELEVFELIGLGVKTTEMAKTLNVSEKTIETHRVHIKKKLQLKSNADLLTRAIRWTSRVEAF